MKELRAQQQRKRRTQLLFAGGFGAAVVIIVLIVVVAVATGGKSKKTPVAAVTTTSAAQVTTTTGVTHISVPLLIAPAKLGCPKLNGSSPHYTQFPAPPPMCINPKDQYTANMVTDIGAIKIKLLASYNPVTVNNFVYLALYHFYDGTEFHRVVTGFVDQGGDPTGTGTGGPGYSFDGGAPKSAKVYTAGALAMANSGGPASDGSQFFIVVGKGGAGLPANYSYFGQVTGGISVVNRINADGSASSLGTPKVIHKVKEVTITVS